MDKHFIKAVLTATSIIVITGLLPVVQLMNLVFFFWVWIGVISGVKYYAMSTGTACSVKRGLAIAIVTSILSSILWTFLFYGIQTINGTPTVAAFQEAAAKVDMENFIEQIPESRKEHALTAMKHFISLSPQQALKETTMLLAPLLFVLLTLFSLGAGLVGSLLFGDPPSGIPDNSEVNQAS
jgi:hypothetical protein